jgi:hypothetical protein
MQYGGHYQPQIGFSMAKKQKKRAYKVWTKDDLKALRQHSRAKTPVVKIAKELKRTEGTIRMKAYQLGFSVGHRKRRAA